MRLHVFKNLLRIGDAASHAAIMVNGNPAFYGETYILYHLTGIQLYDHHPFYASGYFRQYFGREWPEGDRADEAYFDSGLSGIFDRLQTDSGY